MVRQRRAVELFDHGDSDSPGSTHPASLLARHAAAPYNTASNSGSDSRNSFLLPNTAQRAPMPEIVSVPSNSHQDAHNSHQPGMDSHQILATIPAHLAKRIPPAGINPRRDS